MALAALICLSGCSIKISDADMECVKGHDEVVDGDWLAGKETKFVCDEYAPKDPPG